MPRENEWDNLREEVTRLRVETGKLESQFDGVNHRIKNQAQIIIGLEKRVARIEGGQAWLMRIAVTVGTSMAGAFYTMAKKLGLV